jgi:hypothetical protein
LSAYLFVYLSVCCLCLFGVLLQEGLSLATLSWISGRMDLVSALLAE